MNLKWTNNKKIFFILASFIIIFLLLITHFLVLQKKTDQTNSSASSIETKALGYTVIPETISTYGEVISPNSVTIRTQSSGVIASVNFLPGQHVTKNQLLFTLHSSSQTEQSDQLKAELDLAKNKYDLYQLLSKQYNGAVAKIDLLQYQSLYLQALARYKQIAAEENIASPIDGIVSDTNITNGTFVNNGDMLAYVASQKNDLQLIYQLPGQYINKISVGQDVLFYPRDSKQALAAKVIYVSPALNPEDYNITIRANLLNSSLKSNTFGTVIHTLNPANKVIALPQSLIKTDSNGFYVYILNDENKVEKRYCILDKLTASGLIIIKSGLELGVKIITSNTDNFN